MDSWTPLKLCAYFIFKRSHFLLILTILCFCISFVFICITVKYLTTVRIYASVRFHIKELTYLLFTYELTIKRDSGNDP